MKKLKLAGIAVLVVVAILVGTYFTGSFKASGDNQLREGISGAIMQMTAQGGQPNEQDAATGKDHCFLRYEWLERRPENFV